MRRLTLCQTLQREKDHARAHEDRSGKECSAGDGSHRTPLFQTLGGFSPLAEAPSTPKAIRVLPAISVTRLLLPRERDPRKRWHSAGTRHRAVAVASAGTAGRLPVGATSAVCGRFFLLM